jgi:beta-glucanase (GH16 family)
MDTHRIGCPAALLLSTFVALGTTVDLHGQTRSLVFSDEFSGTTIDRSIWTLGIGATNDNVHYYTDRTLNAQLSGGELQIIARKESYNGYAFTSALLQTKNAIAWRYGRIEARMKMPAGDGFVPAFWMMPADDRYGWWPCSGEIDIMEYPSTEVNKIYGTAHARAYSSFTGSAPKSATINVQDAASAFHVYAIEWSPAKIDYYVDQTNYHMVTNDLGGSASWPFDVPFYIIVNLAVGGGWVGTPGTSTVFPAMMEVDYIRVYQTVGEIGITGPDFLTLSASGTTYSVPAVSGAIYAWTAPAGAQIASGQGTRQILVNWGNARGNVGVTISAGGSSATPVLPVVVANNLLKNPGIEKGVKYWNAITAAPGKATFDIDSMGVVAGNHCMKAVVTTPGANPWDIQFTQSGFPLLSGKQYTVRLKAKADVSGRTINVSLLNAGTFAYYGGTTLTLSTAWQEYTCNVTPNQNATGLITIDLGAQAGTYRVDDVSVADPLLGTDVLSDSPTGIPQSAALEQNFPNPFNPSTTIRYGLPVRSHVSLTVFTTLGQQIATLIDGEQDGGYHDVRFDGTKLPSGIYFYRLQSRALGSVPGHGPGQGGAIMMETRALHLMK